MPTSLGAIAPSRASLHASLTAHPLNPLQQIELKTGDTYRGTLIESEDNWNCQLEGITHTGKERAGAASLDGSRRLMFEFHEL